MNQNIVEKLEHLGVVLDQNQIRQFDTYFNLQVEWNKVMNLT